MIVGHCPQHDGNVLPRCGGLILAADTFLSAAYTENADISKHNEAALEYFDGDVATIAAVYPHRDPVCVPLPYDSTLLNSDGSSAGGNLNVESGGTGSHIRTAHGSTHARKLWLYLPITVAAVVSMVLFSA